jgi:hypothetical protein
LDLLANAHPFLKSLIKTEDTTRKLFYKYFPEMQIPIIEKEDCSLWTKDYQALTECGWNVFCEGLLKAIVYPGKSGFEILFVVHHLLGDGRSILGLMCEFADCYTLGNAPSYTDEQLICSIHDLRHPYVKPTTQIFLNPKDLKRVVFVPSPLDLIIINIMSSSIF